MYFRERKNMAIEMTLNQGRLVQLHDERFSILLVSDLLSVLRSKAFDVLGVFLS